MTEHHLEKSRKWEEIHKEKKDGLKTLKDAQKNRIEGQRLAVSFCGEKALGVDGLTCLWSVVSAFYSHSKHCAANPSEGQLANSLLHPKIPPAFFRTSHNHRAKQPTTTFPRQNTFSSSISTQLVKLTQGNIMDGVLTGNYVVRCKSFLKRGLLK